MTALKKSSTGRDRRAGKPSKLADLRTPLLYDFWYVAGYREDFSRTLQERTFLNRSLVIYRTQAGEPVALQNRCAHRAFPLAESWLEGDDIRCRYHGAKFDPTGAMIDVPCQANCPKVKLRKYPLVESGPLVWIWMGDPEQADRSKIPDLSWLDEAAGWEYCTGSYHLEGNYLLMMENLMDLTHIPFLHQETFNFPPSYAEIPVKVEIEGHEMVYLRRPTENYHRSGFLPPDMEAAFDDRDYQARSGGRFVSPAMTYGIGEFTLKDTVDGERADYVTRIPHFLTPETDSTSHYWFFHTRNFAQEDKAFTRKVEEMIKKGFDEDKTAIKHLQDLRDRDDHPDEEIHFGPDAPTLTMRRIVYKLAAAEAGGHA